MDKLFALLFLLLGSSAFGQIRRTRFSASKPIANQFNCPEDFGYYPHPSECTKYYVCVFGGALLESCNGGLMYSNDLQTCDWPRNVKCFAAQGSGVSTVTIVDPRTTGKGGNHLLSATESLTQAASTINRGVNNKIGALRPTKVINENDFSDNKIRQARLIPDHQQESRKISTAPLFQAESSFNFVSSSSPKPKISFPPSLPSSSSKKTNHFTIGSSKSKEPTKTEDFYSDFINLNNTDDYYYYYDDLLYDDYYESSKPTTTTTQRPKPVRRPSSSGSRSKPQPAGPPQTVGPTASRPRALFPQPRVDEPAAKCDRQFCKLPDCNCGGDPVPGGIPPQKVPQMVLLTFDDSVNDLNKKLYVDLFERGRVNPNGCPIVSTMYVSHEWTDYMQVQNLYSDGHEIASHSITHSFGEKFSTLKWAREISGQREVMSAYGGVRMDDIRGMRAPFLAIGGNNMFRMLYDHNFTYDSSMPVYQNDPPSWPYTLDYKQFHNCMIPPCPTNSYPGVWQVPMVMWTDLNGGRCSMGDACTTPPTAEGVYQMLIKNFERHYTTNRAPFGLFYHAAWFTRKHHKEGFVAFLDTIAAMDDVWLVTNWQALQWVRDPQPLSTVKQFKAFGCNYPERPPRCNSPKVCNVWHKGSVRYLKTCQRCPDSYPWVGHTGVQSDLNV